MARHMYTWLAPAVALVSLWAAGGAVAQAPQQVNVSVKIIEFQTIKGVETGLSAFFQQRNEPRPYAQENGFTYGRVASGNGNVETADITFPTRTNAGITVFLDQIETTYGDIELVLQALVDQNRASILARPKAMVQVGSEVPTRIETTQDIPYEDTRVVGSTAVQVTSFRPTGVVLEVRAQAISDDDGDLNTTEDTYIQLNLTAGVNEEGQRITVALDDFVAADSNPFGGTSNALSVPEFISREIATTVWVQHGQVLILGGLYRNTKSKNLATTPWLIQGEDFVNGVVQRFVPFAVPSAPLSSSIGNQQTNENRRELVFMLKAELWRPSFTVIDEFGFEEEDEPAEPEEPRRPGDVITDVFEGISEVPQGVVEGITGTTPGGDVSGSLGGRDE